MINIDLQLLRKSNHLTTCSRRKFLAFSGLSALALSSLPRKLIANEFDLKQIDWPTVLNTYIRDAFSGLAAYAVPSNDPYSQRQGVTHPEMGGVHNGADQFLTIAFDIYAPYDKNLIIPLITVLFATRDRFYAHFGGQEALLPDNPANIETEDTLAMIDQAFFDWLDSSEPKPGAPLSIVVATLLNLLSSIVSPNAYQQGFYQGFSHLSWQKKTQVLAFFETRTKAIVNTVWADPETPLGEFLVGLMEFISGSLIYFAHVGSYSEPQPLLDQDSLTLIARPPGWDYCQYQIGSSGPRLSPAKGWGVLVGYVNEQGEIEHV